MSTSILFSLANSSVSSIGNPYVSYNLKAKSLFNLLPDKLFLIFSNSLKPFSSVLLNLIFSFFNTSSTTSLFSSNSL